MPSAAKEALGKPVLVVLPNLAMGVEAMEVEREWRRTRDYLLASGIPVFPTMERAATAYVNLVRYFEDVS